MARFIDLTGRRFGRLVIKGQAHTKRHPGGETSLYWNCQCDCGQTAAVSGRALRGKLTLSCGCFNQEQRIDRHTTHGLADSPEYRAWQHLIGRCTNPNDSAYANYGGRGIAVCEEWLQSFEAFYAHVGARPTANHSIDRYPDNDGNYEPGNVRWATRSQQMNNRRPFKLLTHCKRGHELTPGNIYIQKKTGARFCCACRSIREKRRGPRK